MDYEALAKKYGGTESTGSMPVDYDALAKKYGGVSNQEDGLLTKIRKGVESVIEPAATVATGLVSAPVAGFAGMAGDIYSGLTGRARIGDAVASDVQSALTYQPRSQGGQENIRSFAKAFDASKLAGLPIAGGELPAIAQAARQQGPLMGALPYGAGGVASIPLRSAAESLMNSALKPTLKMHETGKAEKAVATLLDQGINVSSKGLETLQSKIDFLNSQIADSISGSGATVSKSQIASALDELSSRVSKQANPESDMAAVAAARQEFLNHPLLKGIDRIPVALAQEIKRGTYQQLSKKYGEMGSANIEAQKGLGRGLKEGIAEAVPGISELNAADSEMINALNVTERRVLMDANKNPGGLTWLAHNPKLMAAFMMDRSPAFKSIVANLLNSGANLLKGKQRPKLPEAVRQEQIPPPNAPIGQAGPLPDIPDSMVIPQSWREGINAAMEKRGLPVMAEDLLPNNAGGSLITPQAGRTALPQLPPVDPMGLPVIGPSAPARLSDLLRPLQDENGNPLPSALGRAGTAGFESGLNLPAIKPDRVSAGGITKDLDRKAGESAKARANLLDTAVEPELMSQAVEAGIDLPLLTQLNRRWTKDTGIALRRLLYESKDNHGIVKTKSLKDLMNQEK